MTELPLDDITLEEWLGGPTPEETKKTALAWAQQTENTEKFYEWFCEQEGFHIREERFWDDCERGDSDELFKWLRAAFDMGMQAGRRSNLR